ncbi:hypothetical protein TNCV_4350661 [Trichonephila clavipes]|nr:hypothetical protein TNCV_4350661 [Trichonephila clavipes]
MSYDYTACKRSLECLAWVLLAKLNPTTGSHRQSSGASSREENGRQNYLRRLVSANRVPNKKEIPASRECTRSAMVKHQSAAH